MNTKHLPTIQVPTFLKSEKAKEIMSAVFGQLSDGWGENSRHWNKYWENGEIVRDEAGALVIEVTNPKIGHDVHWQPNGFANMSDEEIRQWLAKLIKKTIYMELKDNDKDIKVFWKRDNTETESHYLNYNQRITVQDVYFVYDMLLGRDVDNKYDHDYVSRMRDGDAMTVKIVELDKERNALYDKRDAEIKKAKEELERKIVELKALYEIEYTGIMIRFAPMIDATYEEQKKLREAAIA